MKYNAGQQGQTQIKREELTEGNGIGRGNAKEGGFTVSSLMAHFSEHKSIGSNKHNGCHRGQMLINNVVRSTG